jgi:hypothetical protein
MTDRLSCPVCGSKDVIALPRRKLTARKAEYFVETVYLCQLGHMFTSPEPTTAPRTAALTQSIGNLAA